MKASKIAGATRVLGAPKGWNRDRDGACEGLPIREAKLESGQPVMISAWKPTPDELERLNRGASVELGVCGLVHPPVFMGVGEVPEETPGDRFAAAIRRAGPGEAVSLEEAVGRAIPISRAELEHMLDADDGPLRRSDGDGPAEGTRCPTCKITNGHTADCETFLKTYYGEGK